MTIKPTDPTSSSTGNHPTLSFPALTFAKLSPSPFLLAHLQPASATQPSIRPNGRPPSQFRLPTVHTGSLSHASGSAVVRTGDTAVVCGVRAEILLASDVPNYRVAKTTTAGPVSGSTGEDTQHHHQQQKRDEKTELADLGLLVPNLELATGCSPLYLPGAPPSTLAQSLSQRILTLLHTGDVVGVDELRIWHHPPPTFRGPAFTMANTDNNNDVDENQELDQQQQQQQQDVPTPSIKAFWTLYIDILFISLDGNPFDAAWAAVLAALGDTKLPRAWWDADRQMVVCDDAVAEASKLRMGRWPIAATFAVLEPKQEGGGNNDKQGIAGTSGKNKAWILADPDAFEEGLCEERVTVVVDVRKEEDEREKMKMVKIEKSGGGVIGVKEMRELVGLAEGRWREWRKVLAG